MSYVARILTSPTGIFGDWDRRIFEVIHKRFLRCSRQYIAFESIDLGVDRMFDEFHGMCG